MNTLVLNVRFGVTHLKIDKNWRVTLTKNPYHIKPQNWFHVYQIGKRYF